MSARLPQILLLFTLGAAESALAQTSAMLSPELVKWAGPGAHEIGFQADKIVAFLQARAGDSRAAGSAPWKSWLEGLAQSGSASLKAWALSRLAEAGVEAAYGPLEKAAHAHLKQLKYSQELDKDPKLVLDPPPIGETPMPGALRMVAGSPMIAQMEARILARKEQDLTVPEYAVLAHNTHQGQLALVRALTTQISSRPNTAENSFLVRESNTLTGGMRNHLNDPRLWLVADWIAVWASDGQRAELGKAVPLRYTDWFRGLLYSIQIHPLLAARPTAEQPWELTPVSAAILRPGKGGGPAAEARKALGLEGPLGAAVQSHALSWFTVASADLLLGSNGNVRALRLHPGPWIGNYASTLAGTTGRWRFPAGKDGRIIQVTVPFFQFDQAGDGEIRAWQNSWIMARD